MLPSQEMPETEAQAKLSAQAALMPQFGEYIESAATRRIPAFRMTPRSVGVRSAALRSVDRRNQLCDDHVRDRQQDSIVPVIVKSTTGASSSSNDP